MLAPNSIWIEIRILRVSLLLKKTVAMLLSWHHHRKLIFLQWKKFKGQKYYKLSKLLTVINHLPFANGDGARFAAMFPDFKIAASYKQNETKMKYTIQYGIVPYFKEQYDGYVQYWSRKHKCIKISYCGTLMVEHCPSEKLLEHFYEFIEKAELDISFMLHFGMDGPNVNLKFEDLIRASNIFSNSDKIILSIGTCPLHIVHNSFRNGIKVLEFDIDTAIDVNFFFKLSAGRRADYVGIFHNS